MKTKLFIISVIFLGMMSCNGSRGKRVYEGAKTVYKEYKAFSRSDAGRYHKLKSYQHQFEEMQRYSPCWQCQGWGVVGYVNENGYFVTDEYGNVIIQTCPQCGGSGRN